MKKLLNTFWGFKNVVEGSALVKKNESFEELVTRLFYGEEPEIQDKIVFDYLCVPELWDVWPTLDFYKVVVNENTKALAVTMANSFVSGGVFDFNKFKIDEFIDVFEDAGGMLFNRLMEGMIGQNFDTFVSLLIACDIKIGNGKLKALPAIAPLDEEALINITEAINDGSLHEMMMYIRSEVKEYKFNFVHLRSGGSCDGVLRRWWESLDVKTLKKIQSAMIREMGVLEFCLELLASKAGTAAYRFTILMRLVKMKHTPPISLGAPVFIPDGFFGGELCRVLGFINYNVLNLQYVDGVPTEDEFKARAVELLLSDNKKLYDKGLFDRNHIMRRIPSEIEWGK